MKPVKKLLAALVALSLTSCTTFPAVPGFNPAVPPVAGQLVNKAIPALMVAWRAHDALVTAVDGLITAGVLVRNTERALRVRSVLDRSRNALNAATNAVRAGNEADFISATDLARQAFADAQRAIGGN